MRIRLLLLLQTPAHRLKDHTSTGHADSPASIVVGKAYLRSTRLVGAAPKVVCNVALFKKDMKMDEDLTGVLTFCFKLSARLLYDRFIIIVFINL